MPDEPGTSMTRADLLKIAVAAAPAIALAGAAGANAALPKVVQRRTHIARANAQELKLLTWDYYLDKSFTRPFEKKWNVKLTGTYLNSDDEGVAKMAAGGDKLYDIVSVASPAATTMMALDVFKPLDLKRLPHYAGTMKFVRSAFVMNGKVYGAPLDWDINPALYFSDEVSKPLTSWNDFWTDPKLQHRFALNDESGGLYIGAAVLGLDKPASRLAHLTDKELNQIYEKMRRLTPRALWTQGGELTNLLANHEVVASMAGWTQVYNTLKRTKPTVAKTLKEAVFKHHGATAFTEAYMLSKRIDPKVEKIAYAWLDYMMTPQLGAKWGEVVGYAPAAKTAGRYMSREVRVRTHMTNPEKWVAGAIVKPDPGKRRQAYVETWQRIRAAVS